ncbi:MAG TPA: VWA domain-containing protein [Vicinamibacterales bacterium]|nr:VWA domain-containing protein [Vicinamibacterales bacterium]
MLKRLALVAGVLLVGSVLASGQQPPPQTPPPQQGAPTFKTSAELIRLDVSVLDNTRLPVKGLTASDFTVLDAGKPQPITAFAEVEVPEPEVPTTAWMRDVDPDIKRNDDMNDRRLIVIVLDDAQVDSTDPNMAANVKRAGHAILDQLGTGDLAAVIYTMDQRSQQDFTTDRAKLVAAVDRFHPGLAGDLELFQRYSVDCLQQIADYLLDVPTRRKAIFYVSTGLNINIESMMPTFAGPRGNTMGDRAGATMSLMHDMQEVFRKAQLANVNIHAIDPSGLDRAAGGRGLGDARKDFLLSVSNETGGFPIVNSGDYENAIAQVFLENSSYYLLGYEPPNGNDGKFHRIEIRVNRPGLTVRSRSGYYSPDAVKATPSSNSRKAGPSPLAKAIMGMLPIGDLPLQVSAATFASPDKKLSTVAIMLGIVQDADTGVERKVEHIDFLVDAFGQDGSSKSAHGLKADVTLKPNIKGKIGYEVLTRIDLKPGRYELRLGAHLPSSNTSGSVYYNVDVPDFSKADLLLSGAVLSVTPALVAAPRDRLADLMPIVPTTNRYFDKKTDLVSAFVKIYQRGKGDPKPVTMAARITDSHGVVVVNRVNTIPVMAFANPERSFGFRFGVPIATLQPGGYLLSFEVSNGTQTRTGGRNTPLVDVTSRRDIRFNVNPERPGK